MRTILSLIVVLMLGTPLIAEPREFLFSVASEQDRPLIEKRFKAYDPSAYVRFESERTVLLLDISQDPSVIKPLTSTGIVDLIDETGVVFNPTWSNTSIINDAMGGDALKAQLVKEQHDDFERWTADRVGTIVKIRLDGETLMSPKLMVPIKNGEIQLTGYDLSGQLKLLSAIFQSGPLSEPLRPR